MELPWRERGTTEYGISRGCLAQGIISGTTPHTFLTLGNSSFHVRSEIVLLVFLRERFSIVHYTAPPCEPAHAPCHATRRSCLIFGSLLLLLSHGLLPPATWTRRRVNVACTFHCLASEVCGDRAYLQSALWPRREREPLTSTKRRCSGRAGTQRDPASARSAPRSRSEPPC